MNTPTSLPSDIEIPLKDFSRCHAGILGHLNAFEEMPRLAEEYRRARNQTM